MPTYEISAPDGNTYRIDGPKGATDDQVRSEVLRQHPNAGTPKVQAQAPPQQSEGVMSGIGHGVMDVIYGQAQTGARMDQEGEGLGALIMGGDYEKQREERIANIDKMAQRREEQIKATRGEGFDLPRTATRVVTEAVTDPISYIGPGSLAFKVASSIAAGAGAEGAGELVKGLGLTGLEPYARFGGGVLAGGLAGAAGSVAKEAQLSKQLPDMMKHKAAANAGYEQMRQMGVKVSDDGVSNLSSAIRADLKDRNLLEHQASGVFNTLNILDRLKGSGAVKVSDIDGIRSALTHETMNVANPRDQLAAGIAIDRLDNWLMTEAENHLTFLKPQEEKPAYLYNTLTRPAREAVTVGTPQEVQTAAALLKHAQGEWATFRKLEQLQQARTVGVHRAAVSGTGANEINTQRQEIRKILDGAKKSRGFSQEAKDQMEQIVLGTWLGNRMREISKYAPKGNVSFMSMMAAYFAAGGPAAAALGTAGFGAKWIGEYLTERQIRALENIVNREAPISRPVAAAHKAAEQEAAMLPGAAALRGGASALVGGTAPE